MHLRCYGQKKEDEACCYRIQSSHPVEACTKKNALDYYNRHIPKGFGQNVRNGRIVLLVALRVENGAIAIEGRNVPHIAEWDEDRSEENETYTRAET